MKRIAILAAAVAAANASAETPPMEHVLVSVPIHKKQAETALPVTVLSGDELQRQAAATLGETLANQPGLANSSFGPGVGRPVIRGQQGARAVTLQNGTQSADVSSLSPDHGVTVEALLADSVEVLRGPSTLLYGGGAIGGVVNVIDNRIPRAALEGVEGAVEYRHDTASEMDAGIFRLEGGGGGFAFHLSGTTRESDDLEVRGLAIDDAALERQEQLLGGHNEEEHGEEEVENTDGFIANSDAEADAITGGFSFHFGERGFAGLAVSHLETEYGIPPGAHGHHEHEEEHHDEEHEGEEEHEEEEHEEEEEEIIRLDMEQTRYDGMLHLHNPVDGIEVLRGFLTHTDYEHVELEGEETGTRFDRETWETRLELVHAPIGNAHGVIGLQWRADDFAAIGEEAYVPETESSEVGVFLVEDFHAGDITYEAGLRVDWVERDPDARTTGSEDFLSYSLSGSALWQLAPDWATGLSLSHSQRAPSTEELFSNIDAADEEDLVTHAATGVIERGDRDLQEETSLNADLSLNWTMERSWAQLSLFYNSFEDYIFLLNSGEEADETPIYLYIQEDAEFYGVEFDSDFHLGQVASGVVSLGLSGDVVRGELDESGDVPRLPPLRLGAELNWRGEALSAYVRVHHAAKQDNPGDFETETSGYSRWDMGGDYRLALGDERELMLFVKWSNIDDEEIRSSTSFLRNVAPESGESVTAGLRLTF
ncbi:MAG: TonB-dependent receptor [Halioglobus sp.]|nr:TonB-dependent receptor [Halioglobus sp.]